MKLFCIQYGITLIVVKIQRVYIKTKHDNMIHVILLMSMNIQAGAD